MSRVVAGRIWMVEGVMLQREKDKESDGQSGAKSNADLRQLQHISKQTVTSLETNSDEGGNAQADRWKQTGRQVDTDRQTGGNRYTDTRTPQRRPAATVR